MTQQFIELFFFGAKFFLVILFLLFFLIAVLALTGRGRQQSPGRIRIKNINKIFDEIKDQLQSEILPEATYKKTRKAAKQKLKAEKKSGDSSHKKRIFILDFQGDIKASAVTHLRETVTALLNIATPDDHVMIKIESGGGMVHAYGLAAAQLLRIRAKNIPLTAIIDKVAASGGYLMACVANNIIAAPFAIIGSIGVVLQLPNFNRLLKEKHIDFEQITAGDFKRTLTLFGENTETGRQKTQEELEAIHQQFKDMIMTYRPNVNLAQVATGEHWSGLIAQQLNLVDTLQTSDDWVLSKISEASIFEISYQKRQSFSEKLFNRAESAKTNLLKLNMDVSTPWT